MPFWRCIWEKGIGEASDRLLFGRQTREDVWRRLSHIVWKTTRSYLNFPGDGRTVLYGEDIFVGYRYYDVKSTGALGIRTWSVIYGIQLQQYETLFCRNERWRCSEVSIDVENTGKMAGSEVVQLYVSDKDSTVPRAVKELKGFAKVFLNRVRRRRLQWSFVREICLRDKDSRLVYSVQYI